MSPARLTDTEDKVVSARHQEAGPEPCRSEASIMTLSTSHQRGFRCRSRRRGTLALTCGLAVAARWAAAALAWHPDLPAATEASKVSGKPVLAIVDASWNNSAASDGGIFASPEVAAVVSACFEPVRIDVDANPDVARQLEIEHVPAACVLNTEGKPLTQFECSPHVSEFIAAAARAAQVAATTASTLPAAEVIAAESLPTAGQQARKDSATATALALATKVRNLAGFAESDSGQAQQPSRFRPMPVPDGFGTAGIEPGAATATSGTLAEESPASNPSLSATPPLWPAEPAAPSALAGFEPLQAQPPLARGGSDADHATFRQPVSGQPASPATRDIEPVGPDTNGWLTRPTFAAETPAVAPAQSPAAPAGAATALPSTAAAPAPVSTTAAVMAFFTKPWSIFSRPKVEAPAPPPTLPPARSMTSAAVAASAAPTGRDLYGSMPLGLEGYCPVTLSERGTWVEGRAQWGVRHRGRTYLFAGPEQQQAFLTSPDRYSPALSGDDPVVAFESGRSEPGRRAYGVTYQARMYLFATPETRAAFSADPGRYTARVLIAEGVVAADSPRRF